VFENTLKNFLTEPHIEIVDQPGVTSSMGLQETAGHNEGILSFSIFTKAGSGTQLSRTCASELVSLMTDDYSPLVCNSPELVSLGRVKDTSLYQHNLNLRYQHFYGQTNTTC
jgi:hypothetical protein